MKLNAKGKIHFIGIGGIGVSALARYYLARGFEVSGSDLAECDSTKDLEKLGAKIKIGPHSKKNIPQDVDLVVYTLAIVDDDVELNEAKRRGIKCQSYAQALGDLTKQMWTISVSGSHGKSTTTAMIGLIMEAAGLDPTVILGTKIRGWGNSNCRVGKSKYLLIEADEYMASFLNYWPKIAVLTNIEREHLDYYRNLDNILKTFTEYVGHLGKDGVLVANEENENVMNLARNAKCKVIYYTLSEAPTLRRGEVEKFFWIPAQGRDDKMSVLDGAGASRRQRRSNNKLALNLKIPGTHNLSNAAAAIEIARLLKIPDEISIKTLNNFTGTWRRMEFKGEINGAKIFDDYGHHPTEIKATLSGVRELLDKNQKPRNENFKLKTKNYLWCVFQPHQYQRTYQLFDDFVGAFGDADKVVLLPIFSVAGREKEEIKMKVSSEMLAEKIKTKNHESGIMNQELIYLDSFEKTVRYLKENLKEGDICVIMGAGDIYKVTEKLFSR